MNKYAEIVEKLGGEFYDSSEEPVHLSEAELDDLEQKLGYPLPADYREFLRDFSNYDLRARYPIAKGPYGEGPNLYGPNGMKEGEVGIMLGLTSSYHLLSIHEMDLGNMVSAPEILALTRDEMGSISLFLAGPRQGHVYLWHRDEAREPYDYANLYFIANSFDEFMHSLYPASND